MEPRLWHPLLEGDLADQAREAVRAIAQALDAWSPGEGSQDFFVGGGSAGVALFYGYLAKAMDAGAEQHETRSEQLLEEAVEALATTPMLPALYSGFTGIAWASEHLGRLLDGEAEPEESGFEEEDTCEEIDEALLAALRRHVAEGDYDLINGLVGFGVYALERLPRPMAVRCLEAIVDRLDERAEWKGGEVTWFTPPEMLMGFLREQTPRGYYNLGVAHGVPGVIALLAAACWPRWAGHPRFNTCRC